MLGPFYSKRQRLSERKYLNSKLQEVFMKCLLRGLKADIEDEDG